MSASTLDSFFLARCSLFQGSGIRVQGAGFRVQGAGFRIQGVGCRVWGVGCRGGGMNPESKSPRRSSSPSSSGSSGLAFSNAVLCSHHTCSMVWAEGFGFRVEGVHVLGLGFRVQGVGCSVEGSRKPSCAPTTPSVRFGLRVAGFGLRV